jgi:hypothetical protein
MLQNHKHVDSYSCLLFLCLSLNHGILIFVLSGGNMMQPIRTMKYRHRNVHMEFGIRNERGGKAGMPDMVWSARDVFPFLELSKKMARGIWIRTTEEYT